MMAVDDGSEGRCGWSVDDERRCQVLELEVKGNDGAEILREQAGGAPFSSDLARFGWAEL